MFRYSAQRKRIHAFAKAWAKAYLGPGPHRGQSIGRVAHSVADYATNWLSQHGEMPTGVHTARAARPLSWCKSFPTLQVDFTPLHEMRPPSGKGQQQQPAADPFQGSPEAA